MFVFGKLVGVDPTVDGEVVEGGLKVLADGDDVAGVGVGGASLPYGLGSLIRGKPLLYGWGSLNQSCDAGFLDDVVEEFVDFFFSFTDTDHDAGLGDSTLGLNPGQQFDRAFVLGARSDGGVASADGLHIVGDDVGPGVDDHLKGSLVASEVAHENLYRKIGAGVADSDDGFSPEGSPPIRQVVAVDAGDDDVLEVCPAEGVGDPAGFFEVGGGGFPGFDIAEPAGPGAGVAEDHDGGDASGPALPHIGA